MPTRPPPGKLQSMKPPKLSKVVLFLAICAVVLSSKAIAQPSPAALVAFNESTRALESRLARQHQSPTTFLSLSPQTEASLRRGNLLIEQVEPLPTAPGALLHHWQATAFAPGAQASDLDRILKNFPRYPQVFAPQVLQAKVLTQQNDHLQTLLRVRQHHILTVVLDTTYDVTFGRLDPQHGFSLSRSTAITEIQSPNTPSERPLTPTEEHGFLWRQNTYWIWEQRDGGLFLQVESISLTRSIPRGLAWAVQPFVESVPRDSLEFALRAICKALQK